MLINSLNKEEQDLIRVYRHIPAMAKKRLRKEINTLIEKLEDKAMEEGGIESVCLYPNHIPNRTTIKALKKAEEGKELDPVEDISTWLDNIFGKEK